jgi:RHS repeat-associated protein
LINSNTYNSAGWLESTTDPRGIVNKIFYDALQRVTKTVEAYIDGTVSDGDDKTVEYTYDASGHMLTLKVLLTGGSYQETKWVYGVTTASGSTLNSNDLLKEMWHPNKSSGSASSSEKESYTVNNLGQTQTYTDRNGSVHTLGYDVLGRLVSDAVTTLGSGVNGDVRRMETAYDSAGRAYLFTSYDAATGGNIVNQVLREFNGLGQVTKEYQSHSGAVNTSTTPSVQYTYSEMASGANHSRLTSIIYPSGYTVTRNYSTGINDSISRLSSLSDSTGPLESYDYLGLDIVVRRGHSQPGVDLTYIKQSGESNGDAGDQYIGLDRFGRVVDQHWLKTSSGTHTDRFQYGYDRDSNRLYRENLIDAAFSELYHENGSSNGYDLLNQLTDWQRGTLNSAKDSITGTPSRTQEWDFDALGNFESQSTNGTSENRTHNKQNQVTGVGSATLIFDYNGNMTTDESGRTLIYDAWNRLVTVKNSSGTTIASYKVDALNHRIQETVNSVTTDLYYSINWQVLEEREGTLVRSRHVWSPVYIDAMVLRDRDVNGDGTLEERLWVQQDANFNVIALIDNSGNVVERYIFDAFGSPTILTSSWSNQSISSFSWIYMFQGGRQNLMLGLVHLRNRDISTNLGRFIQVDYLGFAAGDLNFFRFVGNAPLGFVDPSGLAWEWAWHWHHMLPQTVFTTNVLQRHGLAININDPKWGWMLRGQDHIGRGGVHSAGWNRAWQDWISIQERNGVKITEEMLERQMNNMRQRVAFRGAIGRGNAASMNFNEWQNRTKSAKIARLGRVRSGNIRMGATLATIGTAVVVAGATWALNESAQIGWDQGIPLVERAGYGRTLQLAGLLGELPGDSFDITRWDGVVMHIEIVEQDGQRYFHAWHEESQRVWYKAWLGSETVTVEDIQVGQVPAFHQADHGWINSMEAQSVLASDLRVSVVQ